MDIIRGARAPRDTITPLHDDDRRPSGAFNSGYNRSFSGPLGIPGVPSQDGPPPPLPPPRFVPVEGPQPDHNDFYDRQRRESYVESSSFFGGRSESNYGSFGLQSWKSRTAQDDGPEYARRDSTATMTGRDEGYASLSSYASSGYVLFECHEQASVSRRSILTILMSDPGLETIAAPSSACTTNTSSVPMTRMTTSS